MAKSKRPKKRGSHKAGVDDSHVYDDVTTEKVDLKEEAKSFAESAEMSLGFDPHFLTEKVIELGKALTGIPLYEYQVEPAYRIIYSVLTVEGASLTMLFSRQSGKTETVAFVACTLTVVLPALATVIPHLDQYKNGIKIGLFAPQSDQVDTTYGRTMTRLLSENAELVMSDPDLDTWLESESRLQLSNGSYMAGQTASKQSKIESKTYDLIFIEEAQDMDTFMVQKSIEPMVSATNGTIVKIGTTGTSKNDFWFEIQENVRLSRREKDPRLKYHFENDYKRVIASKRKQYDLDGKIFHLNYEKDVMKKKRKWGEDSDAFRLSYALRWALESGMFITDKDWKRILNKRKGFAKELKSNWTIVAGLDIGKETASTVLTIARTYYREGEDDTYGDIMPVKEILAWIELRGEDYEMQHRHILEALVEWEVQTLYADYTGVGKAVVDRLMYSCGEYVSIIPYTFSRPSKSDMWLNFQADIRKGRFIVPANAAVRETNEYKNFVQQMDSLLKWYEGSYLVAEASEDENDDYCDSAALMCLAGNTEAPDEMEDEDYNPLLDGLSGALKNVRSFGW